MRTVEHINRELQAANRELIKWEIRVKGLKREQKEALDSLTERVEADG
jgi:hypothetical protein